MRRWVCRICGRGKTAPERMTKDDVRRWCLGCSEETGRLVERACPAVEKKRAAQRERTAARRDKRTKRNRALRREAETYAGVHIPTLVEQLRRTFVRLGFGRMRRKPQVSVRRSRERGPHAVGHATYAHHRITMTISPATDRAEVCQLVAHEMAHLAAGLDPHDPKGWNAHGDQFNRALTAVAKAMWDVTVYIDEDGGGYGPSHTLIRELRDKFATVSAHDGSQDGAAP